MGRREKSDACGVVVINKHEGVTSYRIVQILKKLYNTPDVGHTGTLDPMATGVLPVLIGRAVKAAEYLVAGEKQYTAEMTLGLETDTEDITGEVTSQSSIIPSEEEVRKAVFGFIGKISQVPPMYSALKVGGRKLVDMARNGESVEREPREVEIFSIDCVRKDERRYSLDVRCSKGTYIRTLCADIGKKLGCGAVLSALSRECTGGYSLSDCVTLEELETKTQEEREALLKPVESLFTDMREVKLPPFFANMFIDGVKLLQKKLRTEIKPGERVKVTCSGVFVGIGIGLCDEDGTERLKSEKLFRLEKIKEKGEDND